MTGVSAAVLAMIRAKAATYLTDTCTVESATNTIDDYGAPVQTWSTVASGAACRIVLAGNRYATEVREAGAAETLRQQYKLSIGRNVPLAADHRVTCGGVVYDVVQVETALTDEVWHSAILVRR